MLLLSGPFLYYEQLDRVIAEPVCQVLPQAVQDSKGNMLHDPHPVRLLHFVERVSQNVFAPSILLLQEDVISHRADHIFQMAYPPKQVLHLDLFDGLLAGFLDSLAVLPLQTE